MIPTPNKRANFKVIYTLSFWKLSFNYFIICLGYYFVITNRLLLFNTNLPYL
jgi:hypothetical protein